MAYFMFIHKRYINYFVHFFSALFKGRDHEFEAFMVNENNDVEKKITIKSNSTGEKN